MTESELDEFREARGKIDFIQKNSRPFYCPNCEALVRFLGPANPECPYCGHRLTLPTQDR